MLRHASIEEFSAEHVVFRQVDMPTHLHIILDGEVGLTGLDASGEQTVLQILSPGANFTAAAVATAQPYLMGAICLRHTCLLMLPAAQLREDTIVHSSKIKLIEIWKRDDKMFAAAVAQAKKDG